MKCKIRELYGKYNNHRFKFSVSYLCDYVGISRAYFYKIVDNESIPTLNIAYKICDYLNNFASGYLDRYVNVYDLWTRTDDNLYKA